MKLIVFIGPSLPQAQARQVLAADFRPPAARGDVYRAALEQPWGIGIVDGYFERVPAVWHKEILWALSRGIHVFGASSMGALRAAELAAFGMVGVGEIFEAFRDGQLTDDDEVTLAHAGAEAGYRAGSTALVDIRATLAAARAEGVLDAESARVLLAAAKRMHYAERSYQRMCEQAGDEGLDAAVLARLQRWLPTGCVQLKRDDAVRLLEHMRASAARDPGPKQVSISFEHTDAFERFVRTERAPLESEAANAVIDELRLAAARYERLSERSWARLLGLELAERLQIESGDATYRDAVQSFRHARGLHTSVEVQGWLEAHGLGRADLERLLRDRARVHTVRKLYGAQLERALLAELHDSGEYPTLAARARHKRELLERHGLHEAAAEICGLSEHELLEWYGRELGEDVEVLRGGDAQAMRTLVAREYLYRRLIVRSVQSESEPGDQHGEEALHRGLEAE